MLRGNKSTGELRFELLMLGIILVTAAVLYVVFPNLRSLMLFIPGLILLGSAIYQDMQPDWKAGWLTYALAILMVATGLAWLVNTLLGSAVQLNWIVIAAVELGAILIAKALYDPTPRV
jgi:apolipoprotein N-acyltransferase